MVNIKTYFFYIGLLCSLLTFFGCGAGGSTSTDSNVGAGSIGFGLSWDSPDSSSILKSTAFRAASIDVCTDYGITTINAYVINSANSTVTSGSWACSEHAGSHTAVPAGSNYTLRVEAVVSGAVKWRGEVTGISIITGQTTNLGQITMSYIGNDTTSPTVTSTSPASNVTSVPVNSTVTASFSEKIAPSSLDTTTFTLTSGPNQINGTVSYDQTTMTATFTPISPLSYSTTYTASLTSGVKDMAGNNLQSVYTWTFTTGSTPDTTPPTVSSTNPANSATNVAVNTAITATFSETMDASTVSPATFTLNNGVTGSVTYTGTTATFTPSGNLAYSTIYTATISTGVKDSAGNAMSAAYTWTFTTASAPGSAPSAPTGVIASGGDGQVAISWNAVSGATSYNIYWSTTSGVSKTNGTKIASATSPYTHSGLTNGTTYYYVVTAENSYGESTESSQVSAMPQAASQTTYTLTVTKSGTGGGMVGYGWSTGNIGTAGISWLPCSISPPSGAVVTLTAHADATSTFAGWNGSGCSGTGTCTVTMDAAKTVTAAFTASAPAATGRMPDTNQTTSYTNTFGEDHDYTINPPSYTDNGDGTITDNVTGLIWQKQDDGVVRTWDSANTYCTDLTLAGQTDWRLPSRIELVSIIDNGVYNPSINTAFFPGTISSYYWSSTTYASNTSAAWGVPYDDGSYYYGYKSLSSYVRCVRGGQ